MTRQHTGQENDSGHGVRWRIGGLSLLVFAGAIVCRPGGVAAAPYGGGAGTVAAPYLINTAEDFVAIGNNPGDWDKRFKLMRDIDLSEYNEANYQMIGRWSALGSSSNRPFHGDFDGNGKTIANFTYRNMAADYVGLFQHVTGDIRNLRLLRPKVIGNQSGTGALVGYLEKGSVLTCSAEQVSVSGNRNVGGLVGSVQGGAQQCWSSGSVTGVQYVGGLVGQVGLGTVAFSFSRARVQGNESVGGLVGAMVSAESIVNSSYARGDVDGNVYVGGLVGQVVAGRVYRCYASGQVTGSQYPGGLVGYQRALADVIGSLWDTESSTQAKSVGGSGRTTAEMKLVDTYLTQNWDFWNVWTICESVNYPVLLWQIPLADFRCPDGVDFQDFATFALHWRQENCGALNLNCDGADFDASGSVEFGDLAIFAANWLAGI
jgi:hypothetical protein